MLKTREGKPPQSADLLVCFPSRSHLPLMPKPICSPARPSDHNKRRHHHRRKRSISMLAAGGQGGSPSLDIAEPTSPKVTCAGQIKVRHNNTRTTACRSWQSVMEEIEKIHNRKKQRNHLGFKKEVMQFLTCLRSIRFDFRCFGSFPGTDIVTSDDDEEEEEEEEDEDVEDEEGEESSQRKESGDREEEEEGSRTVFSKWFMVVQEHQSSSVDEEKEKKSVVMAHDDEDDDESVTVVPPRNALLLMRCRSAPAKSWVKRENEEGKGKEKVEVVRGQSLKSLMEEEKRIIKTEQDNNNNKNKNKKLLVMRYESAADWISSDIAKETWIVGGLRETLLKARSCKR